MRIDLTLAQVSALTAHLRDEFDEDERGWIDTLEGETDALELVRKLLDRLEREEGDAAALTEQMGARKVRRDQCEARIERTRETIAALLDCARLDKLPLPEATISLRMLPAKVAVNKDAPVPDDFTVAKPVPDMAKIKAAFSPDDALPNWLRLEPSRPSITIRRK